MKPAYGYFGNADHIDRLSLLMQSMSGIVDFCQGSVRHLKYLEITIYNTKKQL